MLDDFRKQADESPFYNDDIHAPEFEPAPVERRRYFLGMTPAQRFVIALMLLFVVCLIGTFGLLVMGKVVLPLSLF
jgi:hypothetical protein